MHVYGVFYEKGERTELLELRSSEDTAREAALTEVAKRESSVSGGVKFAETLPNHPHGPNPDVFAWRADDGRDWPRYVFVRKLEVKP